MELLERIKELLEKKEVSSYFDDGDLFFLGRTGPISTRIRVSAEQSCLCICAHIPLFVPAKRRLAIAEALSYINFNLRFTRFEMDGDDGELRCRADIPLFDAVPTDQQLTRLMFSVWSNVDRYAQALIDVMSEKLEPAVAIAMAESTARPSVTTEHLDRTLN